MLFIVVKTKEKPEVFLAKCKDAQEARRLANLTPEESLYSMVTQSELEILLGEPLLFVQFNLHKS